jgi:peptide/nickel transport system permease protein
VISYILRRFLLMIPVAFLVTIGVFALARLSPVDPVLVFAGEERDPVALAQIRTQLGLDQPLPVQYVAWISRAVQGDLGRSFQNRQQVSEAIIERLPATFQLGLAALLISVTFALLIGILSAVKRNSVVDLLSTSVTLMGVSFPSFFLGIVLILLFAYVIPGRIFPPGGYVPLTTDAGENLRRLVLPAVTLASASLAVNLR